MRNSCDFEFKFDKPDGIYAAGETVSGTLVVTPKKSLRSNGLKLELRWRTHGRGNRASGKPLPVDTAFNEVQLDEGQRYEATFSFSAPPGPLTYRGHYLNIDWYLRAVLDAPLTPGFLDPQGETELLLLPSDGAQAVLGPHYKPPKDPASSSSVGWVGVVFGSVFSLLGLVFIVTVLSSSMRWFVFFPLVFMALGAYLVFFSLRNFLASSKLGAVKVSFNRRRVMPGDTVEVGLEFEPRSSFQLDKITMTLKGRETVVRGSGSNRKTFHHTVFEHLQEVRGPGQLKPSEQVQVSGVLTVPPDAPYTFVADDNKLAWELEVLIDTKGILDWQQSYQLDVVPWRDDDYIR